MRLESNQTCGPQLLGDNRWHENGVTDNERKAKEEWSLYPIHKRGYSRGRILTSFGSKRGVSCYPPTSSKEFNRSIYCFLCFSLTSCLWNPLGSIVLSESSHQNGFKIEVGLTSNFIVHFGFVPAFGVQTRLPIFHIDIGVTSARKSSKRQLKWFKSNSGHRRTFSWAYYEAWRNTHRERAGVTWVGLGRVVGSIGPSSVMTDDSDMNGPIVLCRSREFILCSPFCDGSRNHMT